MTRKKCILWHPIRNRRSTRISNIIQFIPTRTKLKTETQLTPKTHRKPCTPSSDVWTHSSRKRKYSFLVSKTSTSWRMLGCFTLRGRLERLNERCQERQPTEGNTKEEHLRVLMQRHARSSASVKTSRFKHCNKTIWPWYPITGKLSSKIWSLFSHC